MTEPNRTTQTKKRLLRLFEEIDDKDTKRVIVEVVQIEAKNRSATRFPLSDVREVIESVARKSDR